MLTRRTVILSGAALSLPPLTACAEESNSKQIPVRANLYQCEGCEGVFERNAHTLTQHAMMAGPDEPGERLNLIGTVYHTDGITPAAGIVLYFYQTNADGLYAGGTSESEWSRRHGKLRAWVRTGQDGKYAIETIKPGSYPGTRLPAHIHPTVLEPLLGDGWRPPYWIDDVVFDGELGVTESYKARMTNKGGNGVVQLSRNDDGTWLAVRDIVLEQHP
jgi:protocatechuate 3,4-dioxygenase beta subunit